MNRRFLNLIVQDLNTRMKSLYLIDPSKHLFYPPTATGEEREAAVHADPEKEKRAGVLIHPLRLHKPHFRFGLDPGVKPRHFFSALVKENCLLLADSPKYPFLHNTDLKAHMRIPAMNFPKGPNCVSFCTPQPDPYYPVDTHCLYVLDVSPANNSIGSTFEVLNYMSNNHISNPLLNHNYDNTFYWRTLPQPPFLGNMCSSMMVGGSTICISSIEKVVGTYSFDMVTKVWTQVGNWVLPFHGKAEYVPELNLYFALSADRPHRLCAFHCTTCPYSGPPTLQHTFDYLELPELSPYKCHLVNLGSGSFCIVSLCKKMNREYAVFTGVEVKPCRNGDGPLQMIKHLSKRYSLGSHSFKCVL